MPNCSQENISATAILQIEDESFMQSIDLLEESDVKPPPYSDVTTSHGQSP